MSTRVRKSFRIKHKFSHLVSAVSRLTRVPETFIMEACVERGMVSCVPEAVEAAARSAAIDDLQQIASELRTIPEDDGKSNPASCTLKPEIVYALAAIANPKDWNLETPPPTETDVVEHFIRSQLMSVAVEFLSKRYQIGDKETADALRRAVLGQKPRQITGPISTKGRWVGLMSYCKEAAPIALSERASGRRAAKGMEKLPLRPEEKLPYSRAFRNGFKSKSAARSSKKPSKSQRGKKK